MSESFPPGTIETIAKNNGIPDDLLESFREYVLRAEAAYCSLEYELPILRARLAELKNQREQLKGVETSLKTALKKWKALPQDTLETLSWTAENMGLGRYPTDLTTLAKIAEQVSETIDTIYFEAGAPEELAPLKAFAVIIKNFWEEKLNTRFGKLFDTRDDIDGKFIPKNSASKVFYELAKCIDHNITAESCHTVMKIINKLQ